MKGKILDFNLQDSQGIILSEDGERYSFVLQEWISKNIFPTINAKVDFITENAEAKQIYLIEEQIQKQAQQTIVYAKEQSAAAIISFVFGLIAVFFDSMLFLIPSIIAIIAGHVAKSNIKSSNGQLDGSGFATAGLVLGYLSILVYLFIIFGFVALLMSIH
jgi:hypothetical protein